MGGELCRLPLLICPPIIRDGGQLRGLGFRLGAVPLVGICLTIRRGRWFHLLTVHWFSGISGVVHHLPLHHRPLCLCGLFGIRDRGEIIRRPFFKMQPSTAIIHEAGGTLFAGGRRLGDIRGKPPRLPLLHPGLGISRLFAV